MKLEIPVERNMVYYVVFSRKIYVYKPTFGPNQNCRGNLNSGEFCKLVVRTVFSAVDLPAPKFRVLKLL